MLSGKEDYSEADEFAALSSNAKSWQISIVRKKPHINAKTYYIVIFDEVN
jgi:hypothetical protein